MVELQSAGRHTVERFAEAKLGSRLTDDPLARLAQELLTRGVQAIKADTWDDMYGQGARGLNLGAQSPKLR